VEGDNIEMYEKNMEVLKRKYRDVERKYKSGKFIMLILPALHLNTDLQPTHAYEKKKRKKKSLFCLY